MYVYFSLTSETLAIYLSHNLLLVHTNQPVLVCTLFWRALTFFEEISCKLTKDSKNPLHYYFFVFYLIFMEKAFPQHFQLSFRPCKFNNVFFRVESLVENFIESFVSASCAN